MPDDKHDQGATPRTDAAAETGRFDTLAECSRQLERELMNTWAELRLTRELSVQQAKDYKRISARPSQRRSEEAVAAEALSLFLENRDKHGHSEDKAIYETLRDFADAATLDPSATRRTIPREQAEDMARWLVGYLGPLQRDALTEPAVGYILGQVGIDVSADDTTKERK